MIGPLDTLERIAGLHMAGFEHAIEPAGTPFASHRPVQTRHTRARADLPAGLARLGDLDHRLAERKDIADADIVLGDAFSGDVLAEDAGQEYLVVAGVARPPDGVVFGGVVVERALGAAVVDRVRLYVAGHAARVQPARFAHGALVDARCRAVARERMIAWASRRRVYMVGAEKVSPYLGLNCTLSIAVMPFGLASTRASVRRLGLNGVMRRGLAGEFYVTDNANLILEVSLAEGVDLQELDTELHRIPGVVEHGLFLDEADAILIEHHDGSVETLSSDPRRFA